MKVTLTSLLVVLVLTSPVLAEADSNDFDFLLVLTRQDAELDWWSAVPSQFGPKISMISSVFKGEEFKILPIFKCYGNTSDGTINITFDIIILGPDGSQYAQEANYIGYKGDSTGPTLTPSTEIMVGCFEEEDPFGEYLIKVIATDQVKGKTVQKSEKIELKPFVLPDLESDEIESLFFVYPTRPQPSKALASFLNHQQGYINERGQPVWAALWFYKHVFEDNGFLIPHTVSYFAEKATKQQKKDILLLFHLLNKVNLLPIEEGYLKEYGEKLKDLSVPDPYSEISTGEQLDMLWAEFFSTSHVRPARQIITALNLSKNAGTIEKVESGELDVTATEVRQKAMLEVVFRSAVWSIDSNCTQSPLFFRYCVGFYESDQLNKTERALLGSILKRISEGKKGTSDKETEGDKK